mmetsp:Transcript_77225/g.174689  ORF Transcript_77225/g.174689 Transcript_77225/m.174689 type:complete len:246 (+) Transcript_77225:1636-2373(+)
MVGEVLGRERRLTEQLVGLREGVAVPHLELKRVARLKVLDDAGVVPVRIQGVVHGPCLNLRVRLPRDLAYAVGIRLAREKTVGVVEATCIQDVDVERLRCSHRLCMRLSLELLRVGARGGIRILVNNGMVDHGLIDWCPWLALNRGVQDYDADCQGRRGLTLSERQLPLKTLGVKIVGGQGNLAEELVRLGPRVAVPDLEFQGVPGHKAVDLSREVPDWIEAVVDRVRLELHLRLAGDLNDAVWV